MKLVKGLSIAVSAALLAACGSDSSSSNGGSDNTPTTYNFDSKLNPGTDAVSYSGQATRHALIAEMKKLMASANLVGGTAGAETATKEQILEKLNLLYKVGTPDREPDSQSPVVNLDTRNINSVVLAEEPSTITFYTGDKTKETFAQLSADKNLQSKMAGMDNPLTAGEFIGWTVETPPGDNAEPKQGVNLAPNALLEQWLDQLATLQSDGVDAFNDGKVDTVTPEGLDLLQLIQKFLLGAVTYSQAAEDYLKADKGLEALNTGPHKTGKPYTALEHQWDEGYGYFGAARDYGNYSDVQNSDNPAHDTNLDGDIEFYSEYSFGNSINAAKRDKGSQTGTDFSGDAFTALIKGRQLIQDNFGSDPVNGAGYHVELEKLADEALAAWEKAIASTVVHYINDTLGDMNNFGEAEYSFTDHAKHWSEMKGFALGLQFNPKKTMSLADQKTMHEKMGMAPVLDTASADDIAAYKTALEDARTLIANAYDFAAADVAEW